MTNKITTDEIVSQRHKRNFLQWGGPYPGNRLTYAGVDGQYAAVDGVTVPEAGGIDPIWVPNPFVPGRYRLVGRSITPPDLASMTLMLKEKHRFIPKQLKPIKCPINIYEPTGTCKNPSDFLRGWSDYVLIYSLGLVSEKDLGTRTTWDSDDAMEDSLSLTLVSIYPIGSLAFCQEASSEIDRQVVDVVFGSVEQCSGCGAEDDGTKRIYAVTKSSGGSPGLPSEVVYSLDGGLTWSQANIDGMTVAGDALAIEVAGQYVIVIGAGAVYYSELNAETGVPGTFTKVTTGIVDAGTPRDLYVASPREIWMCGDGGYVYKSTDVTAGFTAVLDGGVYTDDLKRISGDDDGTIVAVGANGQILYSTNRGATWTSSATTPTAATLQAINAKSDRLWWIGTATGLVYYTQNGGASWSQLTFSGSGTGQIYDIVSATEEVMYIAKDDATPTASILASWNGGQDWTTSSPRIVGLPVFDSPTRLAVPDAEPGTAANTLAVGGIAGDATDGILLIAVAASL